MFKYHLNRYYAAFPALSDKSSGNLPHNSVDGKVWAEVAARQTEMPGELLILVLNATWM